MNESKPTLPQLLDVGEVAKLLRVSIPTVRRWVCAGKLRPVKLGRRRVFQAETVRAFVELSAEGDNDNARV